VDEEPRRGNTTANPKCDFLCLDVLQAEKVFAKVKRLDPYRIEGKNFV